MNTRRTTEDSLLSYEHSRLMDSIALIPDRSNRHGRSLHELGALRGHDPCPSVHHTVIDLVFICTVFGRLIHFRGVLFLLCSVEMSWCEVCPCRYDQVLSDNYSCSILSKTGKDVLHSQSPASPAPISANSTTSWAATPTPPAGCMEATNSL